MIYSSEEGKGKRVKLWMEMVIVKEEISFLAGGKIFAYDF